MELDDFQVHQSYIQAVQEKKKLYFSAPDPPNYFQQFLEAPIRAKFNNSFKFTSSKSSNYRISATGYVTDFPDSITGVAPLFMEGTVEGYERYRARIQETTPQPLDTNIEGFFRIIGNTTNDSGSDLIRKLREHYSLWANLILGLENLKDVYGNQKVITDTIEAVDRLWKDGAVSVDAQGQLIEFVEFARKTS